MTSTKDVVHTYYILIGMQYFVIGFNLNIKKILVKQAEILVPNIIDSAHCTRRIHRDVKNQAFFCSSNTHWISYSSQSPDATILQINKLLVCYVLMENSKMCFNLNF